MYETMATTKNIYLLMVLYKEEMISDNEDYQLNSKKEEGNVFSMLVTR